MQISLSDFLTPQVIQVDEFDKCHSKVVLEPLERGFGHTLGNAPASDSAVINAGLRS